MVLLVGTGYMGREYAKVLKAMKVPAIVVGRSKDSAESFTKELGLPAEIGGLASWLKRHKPPRQAIIAVTEDQLGITARLLIEAGCPSILVEKPGGLTAQDIRQVAKDAKNKGIKVYVGYNRRFYASTQKALEIIKKEGLSSFNFDFTERSYAVEAAPQSYKIKREWFLQNSTHVIDMACFLGGWPKKISTLQNGELAWHPKGAVYAGAGMSQSGVLFSYHADWGSAGRWSVEMMTPKSKLIFRPLEKLQIQKYGSMAIEDLELADKLDLEFKPGIYKQVASFMTHKKYLSTIEEQVEHLKTYAKIQKNI